MKRKFTTYLFLSAVLAAGTAGSIQVFGQSARDQNRLPNSGQNSGQYGFQSNRESINAYNSAPQSYGLPNPNYPLGLAYPTQGMPGHGPKTFTIVNKDGNIERIEKEPGVQLSKEEHDQVNETRQRIQSAVSQIRSPEADESRRKDAKELITKYLKAEFKTDQESRREQVERLEKQVEQLKKQLMKREESQDKLIELRMQLLENDASGLSFPDSWGNLSGPAWTHSYAPPYATSPGMLPQTNSAYPVGQTTPYGVPSAAPTARGR